MTRPEPIDVDKLPATQYLVMEVLAARYRCGEKLWTFPSRLAVPLRALEKAGLISVMHGNRPNTLRARLTTAGRDAVLSLSYQPPVPTLAQAVETLPLENPEIIAWLRERGLGIGAGAGRVLLTVREDLRRMSTEQQGSAGV